MMDNLGFPPREGLDEEGRENLDFYRDLLGDEEVDEIAQILWDRLHGTSDEDSDEDSIPALRQILEQDSNK